MYLCIACLILIYLYVTIHLKSFFLSTVSMIINIASAIPISLVMYKLIFQIQFFSLLHIVVVLIILGIGADNTFIVNDTWVSTQNIPALTDKLDQRLAFTLRRASKAIIATSITNVVAFMGTCFSSIMPISAFGVYAIIIVSLIYFLIIFILPIQYLFYDKHIKHLFSWKKIFTVIYQKTGMKRICQMMQNCFKIVK